MIYKLAGNEAVGRGGKCRVFAWALMWITLSQVSALEVSAETGFLFFDSGVHNFLDHAGESGAEYNFIGNLNLNQQYTDTINLDIILDHDPILLNRAIILLGYNTPFFSIQAGPFIGVFNGPAIFNPGISLTADGRASNLFFGSFQFDTTLNSGINQSGDYNQNRTTFQLGFNLPCNIAICLGLNNKMYTLKQKNSAVITIKKIQYNIEAEYKEKIWYFSNIQLTVGCQELTWALSSRILDRKYTHLSLYAGIDLDFQILPFLRLNVAAEMPIYIWIIQNIQEKGIQSSMLYKCTVGFTWQFGQVTYLEMWTGNKG